MRLQLEPNDRVYETMEALVNLRVVLLWDVLETKKISVDQHLMDSQV